MKNNLNKLLIIGLFLIVGCAKPPSQETTENMNAVDQYIVVFKKTKVDLSLKSQSQLSARAVVQSFSASIENQYNVTAQRLFSRTLLGGVYQLNSNQLEELAKDPHVDYIEKDQIVSINALQSNATWGLDRLDQASLPLNGNYNHNDSGTSVNVYVIDTGILNSHQEFQGRASSGIDLVDKDSDSTDCNGHGTHVAGTIGSLSYGVNKKTKLIGVRVLNCEGSGRNSDVIAGVEWVTSHHVKPAVANMSLGGGVSTALDDAIKASIQAGVTFVVAAGNSNVSACNGSPSRVPAAITVGSSTSADVRSSFSNYGSCVDIFGPGSDIKSTWIDSNTSTNTISGTSMASPHVAGVASLYLAQHPQAQPEEVQSALIAGSVVDKISNVGSGSPNRLLNTLFLESGNDPDDPTPPQETVLQNNVAVNQLAGEKSEEKFFVLNVPAQVEKLTFDISGGTGDADLYIKANAKPSVGVYDCRPYKAGNLEQCSVNSPQAGKFYVLVKGYTAYAGLTLKASYQLKAEASGPCSNCALYTGEFTKSGSSQNQPNGKSYASAKGLQQIWLEGPSNTDFDIYLYKNNNGSLVEVARAIGKTSSEQISYQGEAGEYSIRVKSYSGVGSYKLWLKTP